METNNQITTETKDKKSIGQIILSVLIPIVGIILFFVQRKKTPNKAKANLIAALISCAVVFVGSSVGDNGNSNKYTQSETGTKVEQNVETQASNNNTMVETESNTESSTESSTKNNVVGVNEEFGNNTITGIVTGVDMNYTGYNDLFTEVPSGHHVICVTIKMTNISNKENYVTVSDFDCYVDDIAINAELLEGKHDYNNNIAPGRSAILDAVYVIPNDANSIELEYYPIGEISDRIIIKLQ